MKRLGILLMVVLLLLVGCSNGKNVSSDSVDKTPKNEGVSTPKDSEKANDEKAKGYVFETKGITIAMNAKIAPILKSLGESKSYFEAESCAFQGMEKTYTYSGFELHTYELDKVDYVASVIFLDDSVSTKEGISLNADVKDVVKAYGDKYTEKSGSYTYQLDKSKISFLFENNKVTSIEYMAIAE
jgi:hypothetical protein